MQQKNLPVIVGILLPIVFMGVLWVYISVRTSSIKPQYNFLYSSNSWAYYNRQYRNTYRVAGDRLTLQPQSQDFDSPNKVAAEDAPPLYLYDVASNTSHQVAFDEVKNLTLYQGPSSPDGYTVRYEYSNNGLLGLFGSSNADNGYFIIRDGAKKKLDGFNSDGYSNRFEVIGWLK